MSECTCFQFLFDTYGYNYYLFIQEFTEKDKMLFKERYGKPVESLRCNQKDLNILEHFIHDIGPMHFSPLLEPHFIDWPTFPDFLADFS